MPKNLSGIFLTHTVGILHPVAQPVMFSAGMQMCIREEKVEGGKWGDGIPLTI